MKAMSIGQPTAIAVREEVVEGCITVQSGARCRGRPRVQLTAIVRVAHRAKEPESRLRQRLRDELLDYLDMT